METIPFFQRCQCASRLSFCIVMFLLMMSQCVFYDDSNVALFAHAEQQYYGDSNEMYSVQDTPWNRVSMSSSLKPAVFSTQPNEMVMKSDDVDRQMKLELLFVLRLRGVEEAELLLKEVSDPESPKYGQFKTHEYWKKYHAPTKEELGLVMAHLKHNFPDREVEVALSGDLVRVVCTAGEVEKVYNTKLAFYGRQSDMLSKEIRVSKKMSLPQQIEEIVDFVNLSMPVLQLHKDSTEVRSNDLMQDAIKQRISVMQGVSMKKIGDLPTEELVKIQKLPRSEKDMMELQRMGSGEFVRAVNGSITFMYPKHGKRRGLAPVINPLTMKAGDGSISFSFIAYCQDGVVNSQGIMNGGICGNKRSSQMFNRHHLVRALTHPRRKQNSLYTVSEVDMDMPERMENVRSMRAQYPAQNVEQYFEVPVVASGNMADYRSMQGPQYPFKYYNTDEGMQNMNRFEKEFPIGMNRESVQYNDMQNVEKYNQVPFSVPEQMTGYRVMQEQEYPYNYNYGTSMEYPKSNTMYPYVVPVESNSRYPQQYQQSGAEQSAMRSINRIVEEMPLEAIESMRMMQDSWDQDMTERSKMSSDQFLRYQGEKNPELAYAYSQNMKSFPVNRPVVGETLLQYILRQQLPVVYKKYQQEMGFPDVNETVKVLPNWSVAPQQPFEDYVQKILMPIQASIEELPASLVNLLTQEQIPIYKKRIDVIIVMFARRSGNSMEALNDLLEEIFPQFVKMYRMNSHSIPIGAKLIPESMEDYIIRQRFPVATKMYRIDMNMIPFDTESAEILPIISKQKMSLYAYIDNIMVFVVQRKLNGKNLIPSQLKKKMDAFMRMYEQSSGPVSFVGSVKPENEVVRSEMTGSSHIVSFEAIALQPDNMTSKVVEIPADYPSIKTDSIPCKEGRCVQLTTTISDIQNYSKTWISIRSKFSDGSVSEFSPYFELRPVFPLPKVTPGMLMKLYGIPENKVVKHPRNIIAVTDFLQRPYHQQDVMEFFRITGVPKQSPPSLVGEVQYRDNAVMKTPVMKDIANEVDIAAQYIPSLATNIETLLWNVPNHDGTMYREPLTHWFFEVNMLKDGEGPLIHTIGYGDDESSLKSSFLRRMNMEFLKMGLRGLTVLVASGDDGASGYLSRKDKSKCQTANPQFPASLPWVTAVGGTQLAKNTAPMCGMETNELEVHCHFDDEKACMSSTGGHITSGGGFSNTFTRPWYQEEQVNHYLRNSEGELPPQSFFQGNGRAYPDVSANANNFVVMNKGKLELAHGTAASISVIAAMVAHWNEMRLQKGLPPLGFVNPLLYKMNLESPETFNDILMGYNNCGINPEECCRLGFYASRGWDAVTGLGTPKFGMISKVISQQIQNEILNEGPLNKERFFRAIDASVVYPTSVLEAMNQQSVVPFILFGSIVLLVIFGIVAVLTIMYKKGCINRKYFPRMEAKTGTVSESTVFLKGMQDGVSPASYSEMTVQA